MALSRNLGFDVNPAGTNLFIVQVLFLILTWIASALRAYVKVLIVGKISIDDYLMLAALFGYTTIASFTILAVVEGEAGKPQNEITPQGNEISLRNWYLSEVISCPTSAFIRIAIAILILRISVQKWHRWILFSVIGLTSMMSFGHFFIVLLQCSPIDYFWTHVEGSEGFCFSPAILPISTTVFAALSAIMDWAVALLPIVILWKVKIEIRAKIAIAGILSMGVFAGIALFVRIFYFNPLRSPETFVNETIIIALCAIIELSLGIIGGCIATLPPLLKKMGIGFDSGAKRLSNDSADSMPWQSSPIDCKPRNGLPTGPISRPIIRKVGGSIRKLGSVRRPGAPYRAEQSIDNEKASSYSSRNKTAVPKHESTMSFWDIPRLEADQDGWASSPPLSNDIKIRTSVNVTSLPPSREDIERPREVYFVPSGHERNLLMSLLSPHPGPGMF
ncbi:Uu.00g019720.m01.CDS01 [Anthostomella pinea]|uniref:Uu.00g019720.m01.CDS01 n=1 Tax=Anthostomella pinea TaxID=933095 RepID=A0AAI8VZC8_9PEZI|nr:Uu.00g019720.m01.CDS01 [Anthostomella pinea]